LGGIAPLNDCCFKSGEVRLNDLSIPIKGGTWLGISQSSQTQIRCAVADARPVYAGRGTESGPVLSNDAPTLSNDAPTMVRQRWFDARTSALGSGYLRASAIASSRLIFTPSSQAASKEASSSCARTAAIA
jgi:hypothetical protein